MSARASRRRLLAGLVFVGLAPVKALAATHGNPGAYDDLDDMLGSLPSSSSSSLPDCVLNEEDIAANVTLNSQVGAGNVIQGFLLHCRPPSSAIKTVGMNKEDDDDKADISITCQLTSDDPAGFVVKKLELYLPEFNLPGKSDAIPLGASTFKIGAASAQKAVGDDGEFGTILTYDAVQMSPTDFADLAKAATAGGAVSVSVVAADSNARKATLTYTLPKLSTLYALAKPKLDKLKSDAASGLCKVPASLDSDYTAKFCTTATIEVIGLERTCWELRSLHAFRAWMRRDPLYVLDAREYARRAPGVVRAIGKRQDAARIWLWAYFTGVLPAAAAARLGANRLARLIYRRMCLALVRLSGPQEA